MVLFWWFEPDSAILNFEKSGFFELNFKFEYKLFVCCQVLWLMSLFTMLKHIIWSKLEFWQDRMDLMMLSYEFLVINHIWVGSLMNILTNLINWVSTEGRIFYSQVIDYKWMVVAVAAQKQRWKWCSWTFSPNTLFNQQKKKAKNAKIRMTPERCLHSTHLSTNYMFKYQCQVKIQANLQDTWVLTSWLF